MHDRFPKVPKIREYAELVLADGKIMTGYVFVEATTRIQDLLNSEQPFFAFVDDMDRVYLFNKSAVAYVRPLDR